MLGATTEIVIDLGNGVDATRSVRQVKVELVRCRLKRVSGAGANFTPILVEKTGELAGSIWALFEGSATAVADKFDPALVAVFGYTDVNGKLYLTIQPDAGADNVFDYYLVFKIW